MSDEPQQTPPRRRAGWIGFLFGIVGLLLLNGAADSLARGKSGSVGWMLLALGVGFLVLVLWWAGGVGLGGRDAQSRKS